MTNAKKFKQLFGIYATELWVMSEEDFLKWLNAEAKTEDWIPCSERLPKNNEAIKILQFNAELTDPELRGALDLAISALEKQEVDKCCETCKHKHLDVDASPCCDCIRAKDHYIPRTEKEA